MKGANVMFGTMNTSGKTTTYYTEYWLDSEADLTSEEFLQASRRSAAPGSIAIVIETGNAYMLNS